MHHSPSDGVRAEIIDNRVVLLDIDAGEYLVLDRIETLIWQGLISDSTAETINILIEEYDISEDIILADIEAFKAQCIERGFFDKKSDTSRRKQQAAPAKAPNAWRAWLWMLRVSFSLRSGFAPAYRLCLGLKQPGARTLADLEKAQTAFLFAENFFIFKSAPRDCLPRSLSLYGFLTSCGIRATHVIGIARYPFEAHAWVECDDKVLLDRPDWVSKYHALARI
jgi:hypothetical protein